MPIDDGQVLEDAANVWDLLLANGLDESGYDQQLVAELSQSLQADPYKPLKPQLQALGISTRRFLEAFLTVSEPYARMMSDLCALFERHGVCKTNRAMRVRLELGAALHAIAFDLDYFREALQVWDDTLQEVFWNLWNHDALFALLSKFEAWWDPEKTPPDAAEFERAWARRGWPALPAMPLTDDSASQGTVRLVRIDPA
jgi:hypothetical protein